MRQSLTPKRRNYWIKSLYLFSLRTKLFSYVHKITFERLMSQTILTMSLLPFWALKVSVALLSMQGQKALGFHQKYFCLCSDDERRSYGFGTTWGWVINDIIFIVEWTIPLRCHRIYRQLWQNFEKNPVISHSHNQTFHARLKMSTETEACVWAGHKKNVCPHVKLRHNFTSEIQ